MGSSGISQSQEYGSGTASESSALAERQRRWQSFVGVGLVVAPFLPASNVFFWVRSKLAKLIRCLHALEFTILRGLSSFGFSV